LGVMQIPGSGTTVNVPLDAEADGEFVSTAEAAAFDRDAPALGTAAMTLVKYTKKVELSYELLQDEDSRLLAFLDDFVGRGMAKTHNSLLLTEALANGTAALTLDNAASVTAAEIPELQYKLAGEYDDGAQWIMRRAVEGQIRGLVGNNWQFAPTPAGQIAGVPTLFGRPVHNSAYMGAGTTATKSLLYGNFRYMGMRLAPDITVLRDPYSKAGNGQIVLHYYFRTVYKVLQAEAIVYSTQA
jgi:HK97 family phage major capsid protein